MDLGDKTSRYRMLSNEGEILREGQVQTTKAGMVAAFGTLGRARIAIEVGTHSPWVSRRPVRRFKPANILIEE